MDGIHEGQTYLDEMVAKRGYVLDYHKALVRNDLEFAKASNRLVEAAYLDQRRLDRRTKELIFIVALTVMRASKAQIVSHTRVALNLGVAPEEILEAVEISFPEAGAIAFQHGLEAWCEAVNAEVLEPSEDLSDHSAAAAR